MDIIRTYQAKIQQLNRQEKDKVNHELIISSLRRVWYGTLATLFELQRHTYSSQRDGLIASWRRFGIIAGLNEESEELRFEKHADKLCAWTSCPNHISFSQSSTSICKGCGKAVSAPFTRE